MHEQRYIAPVRRSRSSCQSAEGVAGGPAAQGGARGPAACSREPPCAPWPEAPGRGRRVPARSGCPPCDKAGSSPATPPEHGMQSVQPAEAGGAAQVAL